MLHKFKGICGEDIFIDPDQIEFAYPVKFKDYEVMYLGLISGKKIFIDITKDKFESIFKDFIK